MLEELYLKNIVIFDEAVMAFSGGLNVISGETGAGKSLVAAAIGLALGARANAELLRSGEDTANVSAVFSPLQSVARDLLTSEIGVDPSTDEGLIFERRLSRSKASRMLVAGKPVTTASANILADALLDIAAQNEHTKLVEPGYQRELLDRYGVVDTVEYSKIYSKASQILKRINSSNTDIGKHKLELERNEYKLSKIAAFNPDPEHDSNIEDKIEMISEAENIREIAEEAADFIYEGDDAVIGKLSQILRSARKYEDISPTIANANEVLDSACSLLEDAARAYRGASDGSDYSASELDNLIDRAEEMKSLVRLLECGGGEGNLLELILVEKQVLEKRLEELSLWEVSTEELEMELAELAPELITQAAKITASRRKAGKKLAQVISKELKNLGMEDADFSVDISSLVKKDATVKEILTNSTSHGFEEINFMITPNVGEAPSSIAETASGGEASRAMLAIKSALASVHAPETLLFDEIDTGVGGRLGDVLGRKLYELSRDRQVIVITHLPQIAAYADNHLQVSKATKSGRTVAKVKTLTLDERVEEIAQMINGKAATNTTREQAREMLAQKHN